MTLARRAFAEAVGTGFLVLAIVGSGITAQRLSPHDTGLELLENALATGAALVAIILAVGPVSGAHINPVVSMVDAAFGGLRKRELAAYVPAQIAGGAAGAVLANLMFGEAAVSISTRQRSTPGTWLAEVIATIGLLLVVFGVARSRRASAVPFAVGAYIAGAYFFTASTSFANPAVTLGRMLSNTFAGISPASAGPFIGMQIVGAAIAWSVIRVLYPDARAVADVVVLPKEQAQ